MESNSLDRSIIWQKLMDIRAKQHEKRVSKLGKCSKEICEVGEQVLIQNIKTKKWGQKGIFFEVRVTLDGRIVSYGLDVNSLITTRHRRYLRKVPEPEEVATSSFNQSTITHVTLPVQEPVSDV